MNLMQNTRKLADSYGMVLADRSVSGNYFWNGMDLGLFWQDWRGECKCCQEDSDPLNPTLCPAQKEIPVSDIFHEIGHFIVCPPWAREFREYGLSILPGDFNANGAFHVHRDESEQEGLWENQEQNKFEALANLVGYILMARFQVRPPEEFTKFWVPTYNLSEGVYSDGGGDLSRRWCLSKMPDYGFSVEESLQALRFHGASY